MLSYIIFQRYDRSLKLEEITAAVVEELRMKCAECGSGIVDRPSFVCYPESPSHVTYRARLEGTSESESDSLISLIEDWVRGGPGVIVTGVLMTVDRHCSVAISFLSERECLPPHANTTDPPIITDPPTADSPITDPPITDPPITDPPITDPPNATTEDPNTDPPVTDPITDPTATVIGGIATPDTGATPETTTGIIAGAAAAVVIVLIIAITIAIVVIVFLVLKSRRGEFAVKKSDRKYVHYCTLYLHLYDHTLK